MIIITTNEERRLPEAFVRRCIVLTMKFPEKAELLERGFQHFPSLRGDDQGEKLLEEAWTLLMKRRPQHSQEAQPGQAEYLDLVRAALRIGGSSGKALELLEEISPLILEKYADQ